MKKQFLFLAIFLFLKTVIPSNAKGQAPNTFNLNIENGMPSNLIYGMMTDKNGYLWIATDNGVLKYNGYELKLFNLSNGLPKNDIWWLVEDTRGRIWLGTICDEMGYIYNDKYYKSHFKNFNVSVYPRCLKAFGNGIIFISSYINKRTSFNHYINQQTICVEDNDTIYAYLINNSFLKKLGVSYNIPNNSFVPIFINGKGIPILIYDNYVHDISYEHNKFKINTLFKLDSSYLKNIILSTENLVVKNHMIFMSMDTLSSEFKTANLADGKMETYNLEDYGLTGKINYLYSREREIDSFFYFITNENIYEFDYTNKFNYRKSHLIGDIVPDKDINGNKIKTFFRDDFWGNCIGSTTNGIFINIEKENNFIKRHDFNIEGYRYVGGIEDSISFWWNNIQSVLVTITNNRNIKYYNYDNVKSVRNVLPYNADTFLVAGRNSYFFINTNGSLIPAYHQKYDAHFLFFGDGINLAILERKNKIFSISTQSFSCAEFENGAVSAHTFDFDRYIDLQYDSLRQSYWAYNLDKVFIHKKNVDTIITKEQLLNFGVKNIEKIAFDSKYGNIFLKGVDNVTMYDPDKNTYQDLYANLNLKESSVCIYKNTLIIYGRFGVLFSKILGRQMLSDPVIYPNIKNINYNYIYDCHSSSGELLMTTDKGVYCIVIPSDSFLLNNKPATGLPNYKMVLNYRDTISNFKSGDTIVLNQEYRRLQFDVINPIGNGHIKYMYHFPDDSVWHELNANELTLPINFTPGNYYTISLKVYDDVWRSNEMAMQLYISPHWWQTHTGRRLIWLSIILMAILLFTSSVLITRKLVLRAAKKRSLRMELELKAIYSQINPHFIFNSLNSALLLVNKNKMDEAYDHISRFSRLLRGYLKSSRNKLITIAEEITNLKDYIELQQTRFKNKFRYVIIVDDNINQQQIMIPSLLIQPFVENAINHGLRPKADNGHLKIAFKILAKKNEIICTIEDDGIGRKQSRSINENDKNKDNSYGDLLIKDLVNIFNKYEQMNIEIMYQDKEAPLTGTMVTIQIKNPQYAK